MNHPQSWLANSRSRLEYELPSKPRTYTMIHVFHVFSFFVFFCVFSGFLFFYKKKLVCHSFHVFQFFMFLFFIHVFSFFLLSMFLHFFHFSFFHLSCLSFFVIFSIFNCHVYHFCHVFSIFHFFILCHVSIFLISIIFHVTATVRAFLGTGQGESGSRDMTNSVAIWLSAERLLLCSSRPAVRVAWQRLKLLLTYSQTPCAPIWSKRVPHVILMIVPFHTQDACE